MCARFLRRVERGVGHGERAEDFALAEEVETLTGDAFESGAEEDKADVAVLGVRAGIGGEWCGEGGEE